MIGLILTLLLFMILGAVISFRGRGDYTVEAVNRGSRPVVAIYESWTAVLPPGGAKRLPGQKWYASDAAVSFADPITKRPLGTRDTEQKTRGMYTATYP